MELVVGLAVFFDFSNVHVTGKAMPKHKKKLTDRATTARLSRSVRRMKLEENIQQAEQSDAEMSSGTASSAPRTISELRKSKDW